MFSALSPTGGRTVPGFPIHESYVSPVLWLIILQDNLHHENVYFFLVLYKHQKKKKGKKKKKSPTEFGLGKRVISSEFLLQRRK